MRFIIVLLLLAGASVGLAPAGAACSTESTSTSLAEGWIVVRDTTMTCGYAHDDYATASEERTHSIEAADAYIAATRWGAAMDWQRAPDDSRACHAGGVRVVAEPTGTTAAAGDSACTSDTGGSTMDDRGVSAGAQSAGVAVGGTHTTTTWDDGDGTGARSQRLIVGASPSPAWIVIDETRWTSSESCRSSFYISYAAGEAWGSNHVPGGDCSHRPAAPALP